MFKRSLVTALFCVGLTGASANAQNLCPSGVQSDKLICVIPQVFGPNGLVLPNAGSPQLNIVPHFQNILPDSLKPLNSAISRQVALLPLASPSSGITFSWDPATRAFASSTDSFGPILGERAETIGRHRLFLGFDYQRFSFGSLDGMSLKSLPVFFLQQDDSVAIQGRTCSVTGDNQNSCGFIRDVIKTSNEVDLKIHQFTTFVTFGLTNRIDISMAIPISNVRMGASSSVTILPLSQLAVHVFPPHDSCNSPCFEQSFSNFRTASGIGDITLRVKGTASKGERSAVALGVDVRTPTGDALNFLGAGAWGVKPFVVWSYRSRFSPHIFAGYEVNGNSTIAGDTSTGTKQRLPGQLTYSGGTDVWITKWLTGAFDITGQQVFEARRLSTGKFVEPGACIDSNCIDFSPPNTDTTISTSTGTFNITNASLGTKIKPFANLLITGNVLLKLNKGGLRARAVPLAGLSYTF